MENRKSTQTISQTLHGVSSEMTTKELFGKLIPKFIRNCSMDMGNEKFHSAEIRITYNPDVPEICDGTNYLDKFTYVTEIVLRDKDGQEIRSCTFAEEEIR